MGYVLCGRVNKRVENFICLLSFFLLTYLSLICSELTTETRTSTSLFREDSFATKVMTHFVRLVGGPYLLSIISPIVQSIAGSHSCYEVLAVVVI